jgi:hypothetical protein
MRIPSSCLLGGSSRVSPGPEGRLEGAGGDGVRGDPADRGAGARHRRAAYEFSLDYAKDREAFGRKIIENRASHSSSPT